MTTRTNHTDDGIDAQRSIIRPQIDNFAVHVGIALHDAGLTLPLSAAERLARCSEVD
jgi:hypothetical protein